MFKWLFKKKGCAKHMNNKLEVIGIDHGWSMMKTISQVFVTGVKEITTTPALFGDVLEYEGKFYKVGAVRQEVKDTKVEDDSFYLLTLAAVAKELKRRGLAEAKVFLAVGLPLTRFGAEKNDFIKYLTKNKRVSFKYENESYHIEIDDVAVFPQCYAAVVDKIPAMAKKTLIVDIGSWTIDIMPVINKSPDESKCVTIPKGLITCMRSINEQCVRQLNGASKGNHYPDSSDIFSVGGCKSQHYRYARPYGFFGGSIPFFIRIRRSSIISFCKGWHTGTDPYTVSCTTDNEDSDNFFHQ